MRTTAETRFQLARWVIIVLAASAALATKPASAGYTAIELYPLKLPQVGQIGDLSSTYQAVSSPNGNSDMSAVVAASYSPSVPPDSTPVSHAVYWNALGRPIDLGPGVAFSVNASQVVGQSAAGHAMVWIPNVLAADLNPTSLGVRTSSALWTDGGNVLGWGAGPLTRDRPVALSWGDSAASVQVISPLNPPGITGSAALAAVLSGGTGPIVGWGSQSGYTSQHALLWSAGGGGIDLHPGGFLSSVADGLNYQFDQQVGYGQTGDHETHALLWRGTAGSAVDLNPTQFRITDSYALSTNGQQQVGWGQASGVPAHALLWNGTAASAIDLGSLLPSRFNWSQAYSFAPSGSVYGIANGPDGPAAVEWVLNNPYLPGDADLDQRAGFSDLLILAANYGHNGGWVNGDFNMDGNIGFDDLLILASHYGQTLTAAQLGQLEPGFRAQVEAAFAEVPEPTCLLLLIAAPVLMTRQRR